MGDPTDPISWNELTARAQVVIDATNAELPEPLSAEVLAVPCLFQEWHPTKKSILGVYVNVGRTAISARKGPIILYLRAIESYCKGRNQDFEAQIKKTYLHELGHHMGWNEVEVREHGL